MIRIQGLHKHYNKGRQNELHVINNVTLDLPDKGMVAIFGKSGCGKTTLLNLIGGLDRFDYGFLTIDGNNIRENTDVIRNRYVGYIFQNYYLSKTESCYDNVAEALRLCGVTAEDEISERVGAALANVGMDRFAKRTPDTLSGGQQQRIAIARAIVKNPRIILADEPTGNLDEANTVMIMDLLKAISRDHLVLLVTHEANLVDYYCDTVIELQDGKVVSVKKNENAGGFAARDKNHIYLGELEKNVISDANTEIEYYGKTPDSPIRLRIVNSNGKLYVQINTEKVQILDSFSEVQLKDGSYEQKINTDELSRSIDMSKLPPVNGERFGRLFSFGSSVKSGYRSYFSKRKKGAKALRNCLKLFAAVIVFMSTVFGSAFGDIIDARNAYNHNVFYLYTPDGAVSDKLTAAVGDTSSGIDYIHLMGYYMRGDSDVSFRVGSFETFDQFDYESGLDTNAVYLGASLTEEMELLEGKRDGLSPEQILISSRVADKLLEKSSLGYVEEYKDLIGLVSEAFAIDGKNARVAGIVASDEPAVYLNEIAMAKYIKSANSTTATSLASDFGIDVKKGETTLAVKEQREGEVYPEIGESISIHGVELKVTAIKSVCSDYVTWLDVNNIKKDDEYSYFVKLLKESVPELSQESEEYQKALDNIMKERYFEYYDYYYSEIDEFCRELALLERNSVELWLYSEKGIDTPKYMYASEDYYKAVEYKKHYGRYPSSEELAQHYETLPHLYDELKQYAYLYEDEYYSTDRVPGISVSSYMLSEEDFIAVSKRYGDTHPTALNVHAGEKDIYDIYGNNTEYIGAGVYHYTVIHSNDPRKTEAWLEEQFSNLSHPKNIYYDVLVTPDSIFKSIIEGNVEQIVSSFSSMAVILVLMSVCMYFIMRSSLINRIKEVGIYRAIGVSKKNLVFKFFVESAVLTTFTVFVGFLCTSAFIYTALGMSTLVSELFYYPWWLAGAVLALLYAVSLLFGTLPVIALLRKTPSEILSKYDI